MRIVLFLYNYAKIMDMKSQVSPSNNPTRIISGTKKQTSVEKYLSVITRKIKQLLRFFKKTPKIYLIVFSFFILVPISLVLAKPTLNLFKKPPVSSPQVSPSTAPEATESATPQENGSAFPPISSPILTFQSPQPSPEPSPSTRVGNPPKMEIAYPQEGDYVNLTAGQFFCLIEKTIGGDTSGMQRKHKLNNESWTSYSNPDRLCLNPPEGSNELFLQYKNAAGDESEVYTRRFSFHRPGKITLTISGNIYRDENCNGVRDPGEGNIVISTKVYFYKMPEFSKYGDINSNSDGTFSYPTEASEDINLTLQPTVLSPSGYTSNPTWSQPSFTLNSNNRNASVNYHQVPNEFHGQCQFP